MDIPFDLDSSNSSATTVIVPTFFDCDSPIEILEKRNALLEEVGESWQYKFNVDDFCDNSNELPDILNQISTSKCVEGSSYVSSGTLHSNEPDLDSHILKELQSKYASTSSGSTSLKGNSEAVGNLEGTVLKPTHTDHNISCQTIYKASKRRKDSNEVDKIDKEQRRDAKKRERELKKIKTDEEKAAKNALKVIEKSVKPVECMKYITANLDNTILNKEYCPVIRSALENGGYNFKFTQHPFQNIILWTRAVQSLENLEVQTNMQNEKYCLLILDSKEFVEQVHKNTLTAYVKSLMNLVDSVQLSLALFGLEKYFHYLKNCRKKEFRVEVADKNSTKNKYVIYKDWPKVEKAQVEMALVDLQIFCKNCYIRYIETYEELAFFVVETTKAVAQIPYKTVTKEKYEQESEFFGGDNKNCVSVDKNGNGLGRLWSQVLTLFPLASLEVAEAITSVYPTPYALTQAYKKNCQTVEEKEKLLQDIPIRRAAGPLSAQRRIGPELSKKVYLFFCSEENILL